MTNSTPREPNDVLQRAEAALRTRAHDATPPVAVLDRALRALDAAPLTPTRRFWTMKKIFGTSLAGAIAAGIAFLLFWTIFQQNSRLAFADVIENVRQVQSAKMKMHSVVQMAGQTVTSDGTMYIDETSRRMRQEMDLPNGLVINIFDMKDSKGLMLMPDSKVATRLDLAHVPQAKVPNDLLARLKQLQEKSTKDLGEKEINGQKVRGFLAVETADETTIDTTIWADEKTKLPILVEQTIRNGFLPATITTTDFEWNWPVDESLFKLDIPEGYTVNDAPMDLGKPAEKDVAAALKASTAFNNGNFPAGLTLNDLGKSMYLSLADKSQIEQKMHEQAGNILIVSRGWAYMTDPQNGSDWQWAGANIPLGQKDTPVLWYKPKGQTTFTVFNADLSIHPNSPEPDAPSTPLDTTTTQPAN